MSVIKISKENFACEVLNSVPINLFFSISILIGVGPIVSEIANERNDVKVSKINVDEQPELAA